MVILFGAGLFIINENSNSQKNIGIHTDTLDPIDQDTTTQTESIYDEENMTSIKETESNSETIDLTTKKWTWEKTVYADDTELKPSKKDAFTLTFKKDGNVSMSTDCNGGAGTFTISGATLTFGSIASTKMYCEDSQENVFYNLINQTNGYSMNTKGELIFNLKDEKGSMYFK